MVVVGRKAVRGRRKCTLCCLVSCAKSDCVMRRKMDGRGEGERGRGKERIDDGWVRCGADYIYVGWRYYFRSSGGYQRPSRFFFSLSHLRGFLGPPHASLLAVTYRAAHRIHTPSPNSHAHSRPASRVEARADKKIKKNKKNKNLAFRVRRQAQRVFDACTITHTC